MLEQELLIRTVQVMNDHNIEYMLTGSYVSSLQGQPRSTHDIDIVADILATHVHHLIKAFPHPQYYLDEASVKDAIKQKDMFNVIETDSGNKIDFWLLTDSPFDQSRFLRRYTEEFMGHRINVSSPEDTILSKLRWAKLSGGSIKQFQDALGVFELQGAILDMEYISKWVKELALKSIWRELFKNARPID